MAEIDARARLKAYVGKYPTQRAAAKALGVSEVYVSDMLNGRRDVTSPKVLKALGLRRIVAAA